MGLFVLLCVVPTVVVIAVGVWRSLPGRLVAEQRRLTLLVGQPVSVETVRHLRPGTAVYEGLEIRDPESHEVLVRCDQVRVQLGSVLPKGSETKYPQLRLSVGKLTVTASSIEPFRPLADRLLQQRIDGVPAYVRLVAKELVLKNRPSDFPAQQVEAWATLRPEKSTVDLSLRVEGQDTEQPVCLSLVRNREYAPPVDGFMLSTKGGALPCSLLASLMPPFPALGPGSHFQGSIVADHVPDGCQLKGQAIGWYGWRLRVEGVLQDIDLRKLSSNHVPHEISGTGTLRLKELVYRGGRIHSMIGDLQAENGAISRALVDSCVRELGFRVNHEISGYAPLPYLELAAGFQLDGRGLTLSGKCSSGPPGALLLGTYTERLEPPSPADGWIPPAKAVAAIVATPGEDPLSVSRRAAPLLQRMPYIPTAASATVAAPQPSLRNAVRH